MRTTTQLVHTICWAPIGRIHTTIPESTSANPSISCQSPNWVALAQVYTGEMSTIAWNEDVLQPNLDTRDCEIIQLSKHEPRPTDTSITTKLNESVALWYAPYYVTNIQGWLIEMKLVSSFASS